MNTIGVIGIGKLGLSFALLCERSGYNVIGCDNREEYIQSLEDWSYTTSEPFINEYLQQSSRFAVTTDIHIVTRSADVLFCFVATPSLEDGSYDHTAIEDIVSDLQRLHIKGLDLSGKLLVIGCTTMPGYTDIITKRLNGTGMDVAYNPEFIAQGSIIQGLKEADMVLMGVNKESAAHSLTAIYKTIMTKPLVPNIMSPRAAEITKISINCFLTMKIAYANMIGEIAINSGIEAEVDIVLKAIGSDSRIGNKYLSYGFGYGGPCLPRDMRALGRYSESVNVKDRLPHIVDVLNGTHSWFLRDYYIRQNPDNLPYLFTQLTYKPGTDILTESQQYRLCKELLMRGYSVDITESDSVIQQVAHELSIYGERITYNGSVNNGIKIVI